MYVHSVYSISTYNNAHVLESAVNNTASPFSLFFFLVVTAMFNSEENSISQMAVCSHDAILIVLHLAIPDEMLDNNAPVLFTN